MKILKDINDYQQNEVILMKKYKHIIDNSEEGMIIIKQNKQIDYFNDTFIKYFLKLIVNENEIKQSLNVKNQINELKKSKIMG
jgi:hypothetical protein